MTKKVVYNTCYGGFSLSYKAVMLYAKLNNINLYAFYQTPKTKKFHFIYDDNNAKKLESFIHYSLTNDPDVVFDSEYYWSYNNLKRDDPILVQVVEL